MKLNIYKNQREVAKTYEVDNYDIMYGTIEDVFDILDSVEDLNDTKEIMVLIQQNRNKLNDLLLDIFECEGLTKEELRMVKLKELVPLFVDLFSYIKTSFASKNS